MQNKVPFERFSKFESSELEDILVIESKELIAKILKEENENKIRS